MMIRPGTVKIQKDGNGFTVRVKKEEGQYHHAFYFFDNGTFNQECPNILDTFFEGETVFEPPRTQWKVGDTLTTVEEAKSLSKTHNWLGIDANGYHNGDSESYWDIDELPIEIKWMEAKDA